jgi:hypothetical protein
MSEPEAVELYLWAELWQYKSGRLGWSLKDANGESIDPQAASELVLELGEWLLTNGGSGDVVSSIFIHSSGKLTTRSAHYLDMTRREEFVWVKKSLRKAVQSQLGHMAQPGFLFSLVYSTEWLWHRLMGHFKHSQNAPLAAATPVAGAGGTLLSEASEAAQEQSARAGGNVVQFRKPPRHDLSIL